MLRQNNFDLSSVTTFHLPARAETYIEYDSVDCLREILRQNAGRELMHIGGGSNLLFTKDYPGIVLHSAMKGINIVEETANGLSVLIEAQSGTVWDDFVAFTVDNNLYGAENLSGIPGEVGASAIQNIGAYGVEAKDIIEKVSLLDTATLEETSMPVDSLDYGYRYSIFKTTDYANRYIVTSVTYRLSRCPKFILNYGPLKQLADEGNLTLQKMRNRILEIRSSKLPDPKIEGNAGSFFKNPVISLDRYSTLRSQYPQIPGYMLPDDMVKVPAGWLIEQAGMKGACVGDAMVYPRQCLVIINCGKATSADVVGLSQKVRKAVADKFAIDIYPEVIFI